MLNIHKEDMEIFNKLKEHGLIYIVGGMVRDSLIGKSSNDVDMSSNIEEDKLLELLKEYKPTLYNDKYQIIKFKKDNIKYEIARMREDYGILDGRNPRNFNFTDDIIKDIYRRDYTINAMAYDGVSIIDPTGGIEDIKNRLIRMVGDPITRLSEDKVRIIRAFRLIAMLDFELEKKLEHTIKKLSLDDNLFSNFSKDRLLSEFNKVIFSEYSHKALLKMFDLNILRYFIPEYDNRKYDREIFVRVMKLYKSMIAKYKVFDYELAYGLLFSFTAKKKPDFFEKGYEAESVLIYEDFVKRFGIKNSKTHGVNNLIYYHNIIYKKPSLIMLKRMLLDMVNNKGVCRLINLIKIIYSLDFESENINKLLYNIQRLYLASEPVFLSDLDVLNVDLYNLNLESKKFLQMKMDTFKEILEGKMANTKDAILKNILSKYQPETKLVEEKCAGALVYRKVNDEYQFLIIKGANEGSWGYPKGHIELNENEYETAIREVKEETNIDIRIVNAKNFRDVIKYVIRPNIYKEVDLFLGEAITEDIKIDNKELDDAKWLSYREALDTLTYLYQRRLLKKAMLYLY